MEPKKRSGRPKKAESEKVKYQLIAVYKDDYKKMVEIVNKTGKKRVDVFTEMVANYNTK